MVSRWARSWPHAEGAELAVPCGGQVGEPPGRGVQRVGAGHIQHLAACLNPIDETCRLEDLDVLDHRLPGHRQATGEGRRAGPAGVDEHVQELAAPRLSQAARTAPIISAVLAPGDST